MTARRDGGRARPRRGGWPAVRGGHSLAELLVALALLGVGVSAAGSAMVAAHRWTVASVRRQAAHARAAEVLDSLVAVAHPADGFAVEGRLTLRWTAAAGERVTVEASGAGRPVRLQALHPGDVPVLEGP